MIQAQDTAEQSLEAAQQALAQGNEDAAYTSLRHAADVGREVLADLSLTVHQAIIRRLQELYNMFVQWPGACLPAAVSIWIMTAMIGR